VLHVADTVWPGAHTFFAEGTSVPDWFTHLGHIRELVNELEPRVIVPGHNAFPRHRNQIPLDISLNLIQMVGPMAFLTGRPDGATAARLPTFV
jgi:hypothetical protein